MASRTTLEGIDAKLDGVVASMQEVKLELRTHRDDYEKIKIEQALIRQRIDFFEAKEKEIADNREEMWRKIRSLNVTRERWIAYASGVVGIVSFGFFVYEKILKGHT